MPAKEPGLQSLPSEQGVHGRWDVVRKYRNNANA